MPIMPKATAMWLIDNTGLTFEQIADFCDLHRVEIQAMADGQFAAGLQAVNPIETHQLTREEITRCEKDPDTRLMLSHNLGMDIKAKKKTPKYTPLAKRQEKPGAIAWIIRHYPRIDDAQICSLLSTTKKMVQSIRSKTYSRMSELTLKDPIVLGFCTQIELNAIVEEANNKQVCAD